MCYCTPNCRTPYCEKCPPNIIAQWAKSVLVEDKCNDKNGHLWNLVYHSIPMPGGLYTDTMYKCVFCEMCRNERRNI